MIQSISIRSGEWVIILKNSYSAQIRFFKSLRFRILLILVIGGIVPCVLLKTAILHHYEEQAVTERIYEIQNQCTILCNQLGSTGYMKNPSFELINAELSQFCNIYNGRILVVNDAFSIIHDTFEVDKGKTLASSDVITCYRTGAGTSDYDTKNRYIEVTMPVTGGVRHKTEGVMLVSVSTDQIADNFHDMKEKADIIQLPIIFGVLLAAFFLSGKLIRPFATITNEIAGISQGLLGEGLHEQTYTETQAITDAFNKMLQRLGKVDASRDEFVSNVSHELKTPLTSMKVLADSLLMQPEAPKELYREFLGDIAEEIDRENKIINDLLSLVKMDKKTMSMSIEPVNINALVEKILKRLRPIAAKSDIELVFESFRPVTADIDIVKMDQAITNLVENAIKYNQPEGYVHVSLNADHKYFYLKVEDSGIGIPEEDQDQIFERFYRVDKSHSREIGGTGLGLAITRRAIIMHRGSIKVHSVPGTGTTFNVRVPLNAILPEKKEGADR